MTEHPQQVVKTNCQKRMIRTTFINEGYISNRKLEKYYIKQYVFKIQNLNYYRRLSEESKNNLTNVRNNLEVHNLRSFSLL